jgi:predicted nucleotidyltransferase
VTLLHQRDAERLERREEWRMEVRSRLRRALTELAPGEPVILYGSITRPGKFHAASDVDIAFRSEPRRYSQYRLHTLLEEALGCPVDVVVLSETRLAEKIEREGEPWIG